MCVDRGPLNKQIQGFGFCFPGSFARKRSVLRVGAFSVDCAEKLTTRRSVGFGRLCCGSGSPASVAVIVLCSVCNKIYISLYYKYIILYLNTHALPHTHTGRQM